MAPTYAAPLVLSYWYQTSGCAGKQRPSPDRLRSFLGMLCGSLRNKKQRCQDAKDKDGWGLAGRVLLSPSELHALQISKPESPKSWSSKVVHGCALIPLLMSGNCRQARPRGPNKQGTWHPHSQRWWCQILRRAAPCHRELQKIHGFLSNCF